MKKTTRVLVALLALTLVTSCFVGGTFAKYVTSDSGSDSARVAKFGVTVTADATMFGDAYKDTVETWAATDTDQSVTVRADTEGTKVVAPGTNGALAGYTVEGTPEVDTEVTYTADLDLGDNWVVDGAEYCPIVFNVNGTEIKFVDTVDNLELAVEEAIIDSTKIYETNADLSVVGNDLAVTWAWAYEGNDDAKDTALGDAADGNAATIALTTSVTVTQID